jgi:hypothetical protein
LVERRGVRRGLVAARDGAEDGQHLQADDLRRAVYVLVERCPPRVVGDREVHPHRVEESAEVPARDFVPRGGVDDRSELGIVAVPRGECGEELSFHRVEFRGDDGGGGSRGRLVDDVVQPPCEPVQGVNGRAL